MPFYNVDDLRRSSSGRWTDFFIAAGLPAIVLDGKSHPCPKCGGRDRFAAFADVNQRGAVHCRHCFTAGCPTVPYDGIATLRWWLGFSYGDTLSYLADLLGLTAQGARSATAAPASGRTHSSWTVPGTAAIELTREAIEAHTEFARQAYQRMDDSGYAKLARH